MQRKVILLLAHETGISIAKYFSNRLEDEVVAIYLSELNVVNDLKIKRASKLNEDKFFSYKKLNDEKHLNWLKECKVDFLISVYWPYKIKSNLIELMEVSTVNFHPSFLPYNRGSFPHLFALLNGTPCGVSLHQLSNKIDAGPIWVQKKVNIKSEDTALSLYKRLQIEIIKLFENNWYKIKMLEINPKEQPENLASCNKEKDILPFNRIDLQKQYTGEEWLNLLRARSLGNLGFAYFEKNDQRIYVNLRLGLTEDFLS